MSTRIKRLTFEMLYCKAKSKNDDFQEEVNKGSGQYVGGVISAP